MLDLIPSLSAWPPVVAGQRYAVATVVAATGSVPRPVGTSMLVSESGAVLGSLSGGCVEGAVVALALEVMNDGGTRHGTFGYSAADAFAAGLTCGGELEIHVEPADGSLREALARLARVRPAEPVALVRRLDAGGSGAVVIPDPGTFSVAGSPEVSSLLGVAATSVVDHARAAQLESFLRGGSTGLLHLAAPGACTGEPATLLVESRLAPPRMLVFGANDFGAALVPAAKLLGYRVTLVDARSAFATQARFACADEVVTDWPHRYLATEAAAGKLDQRTVACVLTHDPKFDIPLLEAALALDLAYVGAMGSRRSHLQRVDDLLNAGVRPERIAQLHSPIGLDLGAVTPAEVAVSVTAELIASRSRKQSCTPLRDTSGPIHQPAAFAGLPPAPQPATRLAPDTISQQEIAWT
ncbi:XdhC family protein [Pseudarthrobacter sulfonivorans]|uniref:XdhC family protein n=1 Tax=Pseudarthrobacter sulfonivorans TaxID=121292 RepID=UPI00285B4347|nr:XdhC family protein [Pseudarthrobacter sulfonivorans]MDR6415201.1 xanthine dehydrogenase accessory factor [Pseudarthrobacter sulfonivorans]